MGDMPMAKAQLPGALSQGQLHRLAQEVDDKLRAAYAVQAETTTLRYLKRALTELKMRRDNDARDETTAKSS